MSRVISRSTRPAAAVLGLLLLTGTSACSGRSEPAAGPSKSASPSRSATAAPPPPSVPPSVPMRVAVTRVHGTLPVKARPALEANVGRTVSAYLDAAFLAGAYPRSDFSGAFRAFTPGVATDARRDQGLLTNRRFGPTTESVRATRRTAYLSVLAPYRVAAGVTARVDLVFVVNRGDRPAERVRLAGRLLLTRNKTGGWSIFGYDLHRSDTPKGSGS